MNAIEAVARALCLEFYGTEWARTSEFRQGLCADMARAALTALRDNGVTEGMVEAWAGATGDNWCRGKQAGAERDFRAMLNAALQEDSVANGR